MYENQSWLPVASLFGLVGCSVPGDLKAEILRTLATFALSPEIASNMWVTLEVSQVCTMCKVCTALWIDWLASRNDLPSIKVLCLIN